MSCLSRSAISMATIVIATIALATQGANAKCVKSRYWVNVGVTDVDQTMHVIKDQPCSFIFTVNSAAISNVKISEHPSHGIAGASNTVSAPAYAYSPSQGFVGTDHFAVTMEFRSRPSAFGEAIITNVTVNVDVQVADK